MKIPTCKLERADQTLIQINLSTFKSALIQPLYCSYSDHSTATPSPPVALEVPVAPRPGPPASELLGLAGGARRRLQLRLQPGVNQGFSRRATIQGFLDLGPAGELSMVELDELDGPGDLRSLGEMVKESRHSLRQRYKKSLMFGPTFHSFNWGWSLFLSVIPRHSMGLPWTAEKRPGVVVGVNGAAFLIIYGSPMERRQSHGAHRIYEFCRSVGLSVYLSLCSADLRSGRALLLGLEATSDPVPVASGPVKANVPGLVKW